jgi:hypothetical protein
MHELAVTIFTVTILSIYLTGADVSSALAKRVLALLLLLLRRCCCCCSSSAAESCLFNDCCCCWCPVLLLALLLMLLLLLLLCELRGGNAREDVMAVTALPCIFIQ